MVDTDCDDYHQIQIWCTKKYDNVNNDDNNDNINKNDNYSHNDSQ